jgi:hypothetical protein
MAFDMLTMNQANLWKNLSIKKNPHNYCSISNYLCGLRLPPNILLNKEMENEKFAT